MIRTASRPVVAGRGDLLPIHQRPPAVLTEVTLGDGAGEGESQSDCGKGLIIKDHEKDQTEHAESGDDQLKSPRSSGLSNPI